MWASRMASQGPLGRHRERVTQSGRICALLSCQRDTALASLTPLYIAALSAPACLALLLPPLSPYSSVRVKGCEHPSCQLDREGCAVGRAGVGRQNHTIKGTRAVDS